MINLFEYTDGNDHPFGNVQGKKTFQALLEFVDRHPAQKVFEISLASITATDSSFPRESVISLAKYFRGERWFLLSGFNPADPDLLDNWDYAAKAKEQNLVVVKAAGELAFIGPQLNESTKELVLLVFKHGSISTASVAKSLDISVQNASTRLKKLVSEGLIMRSEEIAASGGKEFIYKSLK
jgi:predicted DNA-binding transcriptional regulator